MAYLLRFDGANDYVTLASLTGGAFADRNDTNQSWELEWQFSRQGSTSYTHRFFRETGGIEEIFWRNSDGLFRVNLIAGNVGWTLSNIDVGVITTFRVVHIAGTTNYELFINGVSQGTKTPGNNVSIFRFNQIGQSGSAGYINGDLYYVDYTTTNSGVSAYWDPSASSGTGSTLPDTVGSNAGTLVNFPVDDSQWVFYSTGQTVAVGLVTETNATFALGKAKAKAVGLSSTTDTALTLSTDIVQAVGLASETNAALTVASSKTKAVGLSTETNTALSTTAAKALSTGQAIDVNTALAIAASKAKAVGLTTETNTALSTTAAKVKAVGIASDTSTSLPATAAKSRTVGQASTLDSAAQLAILKSLSIGIAQQTDTALPLSIAQVVAVGLATETNTALALSTLGLASWVYTVPAEQRIISVSAEQRSYTVPVEQRVIEVSA